MKSCCFTGHRNIPIKDLPDIQENLRNIITNLIESGVTDFWCGGALGFDTLCANYILEFKKKGYDINLYLVFPYPAQFEKWKPHEIEMFKKIQEQCTDSFVVSEKYFDGCMKLRNQHLVNKADICIAYMDNPKSGTGQTVRMAEKKGIPVHNILSINR